MGVFFSDRGQDQHATVWETALEAENERLMRTVDWQIPSMMERPVMGSRRFSWMDQVVTTTQRRQSRADLQTPSDVGQSSPWGSQSPSSLRATAAIWTPHIGSSEADEYDVARDGIERIEGQFAASTIGEPWNRPMSPSTGSNDSRPGHSPSNISNTPEISNYHSIHARNSSSMSDSSRGAIENIPHLNLISTSHKPNPADPVGEQRTFQAGSPVNEISTPRPPVSATATNAQPTKRAGLPELRTTSLSDFRLEDVRGPLATDDSLYAVVEFKLFRSEVYQLRQDWVGGAEGVCLVIVEADRGIDLGKVHHIGIDAEHAREMKRALNRRHWSALLQNSATSKPSDEESEIAFKQVYEWTASSPFAGGFTAGDGTMPPRSIVRRATRMEIGQLQFKEGIEERARRLCWQKAKDHGFTMEILAAEFQFDHQKLTFYFLAPGYVAFNPLINELYKIFKTRIWFVPLNPASFVNPTPAHAHSASGSSGSESFPGSPHPGQGSTLKGNRRDSRSQPVQNISFGAANMPRANIAPDGNRPGQPISATQAPTWSPGSNRVPGSNDWPTKFSPQGFKSPQPNQGPWA